MVSLKPAKARQAICVAAGRRNLVKMRAAALCVAALALIVPLALAERENLQDTVGRYILLTSVAISRPLEVFKHPRRPALCSAPVL